MRDAIGVPFPKIPHQSELFLDYLAQSPKALSFYRLAPSVESFERAAREDISRINIPRREIAVILRRQNEAFGSSPRAMEHIQELEETDCAAIVTGQQVGLFTGPLYTIHKAFTAIRIALELRRRGIRTVPVFWMDSEDHDLAEVTRVSILGPESVPQTLDYRPLLFHDSHQNEKARAVGSIAFPASIQEATEHYLASLAGSPWQAEVRSQLQSTYSPASTFAQSFGRLMARLFRDLGLVLFDPQDREAKRLLSNLIERSVRNSHQIYERLLARNDALQDSGYHTQVSVLDNSTVLFLHDEGERKALTRLDSGFGLKNSDRHFTESELARLAHSAPESFSPNVLLRPLVQDHLFPTIGYVAGPSEIAYFAQIQVLYELFGRPMPVIWPRASMTFLEPETSAEMKAAGLGFEDCLQGKHHVVERLITANNDSNTNLMLQKLREVLERELQQLRPDMEAADSSLGPAVETARRKILHQVEALQTKFVHFEARQNRTILKKADFLLNNCYPNKNLQERELSISYFLARHGPSFMAEIYSQVEPESFVHKVVSIDD
jgi:bacillithiol biosynthesis cysteine-adding enzyme BshC